MDSCPHSCICCILQLNLEHSVSTIKHHYEKLLFPYERFLVKENKVTTPQGSPQGTPQGTPVKACSGTLSSQTPRSSSPKRSRSPVGNKDTARSSSNSPTMLCEPGQHPLRRSRRYQEAVPEVLDEWLWCGLWLLCGSESVCMCVYTTCALRRLKLEMLELSVLISICAFCLVCRV